MSSVRPRPFAAPSRITRRKFGGRSGASDRGETGGAELKRAAQLIESISSDTFGAKAYHDEYRQRVMDLIDQKSKISSKAEFQISQAGDRGTAHGIQRLKDNVAWTGQKKAPGLARHPWRGVPARSPRSRMLGGDETESQPPGWAASCGVSESGLWLAPSRAALSSAPRFVKPPCLYLLSISCPPPQGPRPHGGGEISGRLDSAPFPRPCSESSWRGPGDVEPKEFTLPESRVVGPLGRSVPLATQI